MVGVLALAVHLECARERVREHSAAAPSSVITVTDEHSVVVARSLDSGGYVGRPAERGRTGSPAVPSVPTTDVRVGVDGVERVYGNLVVAARAVAGQRRHPHRGALGTARPRSIAATS